MTTKEVLTIVVTIIIGVISALVAIFAAWLSARSARAAERSVEQERAAHGLSAMREFVLHEYLEREFGATQAPEISGQRVKLLREAKSIAKSEYNQNPAEWDKASRHSNLGAWQNQVAFETAWALNHLGVFALAGMLPLTVLLAVAGDVIIDDWLLCRSWVKSYRESESDSDISQAETTQVTSFSHRWQAEWLALVAVLWMARHWSYPNCSRIAEWYGGKRNLPAIVQALSRTGGATMPQTVRDDIKSLTGIEILT